MSVAIAYLETKLREEQRVLEQTTKETKEDIDRGARAQRRLDSAQRAVNEITDGILSLQAIEQERQVEVSNG